MAFTADRAALERTEQVAQIFDRAWFDGPVDLVTVFGLELCTLGGPRQTLFSTAMASAWEQLGELRQAKACEVTLDSMVSRGLLLPRTPGTAGKDDIAGYSLSPEMGIMLAARCKPTYVVATEVVGRPVRCMQFFAVGDEEVPVRGIVIEEPVAAPAEAVAAAPNFAKLGPLGWLTSYRLVSESTAAGILAQVALAARPSPVEGAPPEAFAISRFRHLPGQQATEAGMTVIGNGTTARVRPHAKAGVEPDVYDGVSEADLRTFIQRLFTSGT